jgi:SAM-dependent methyltransferase
MAHDPKESFGIHYLRSDAGRLRGISSARFDLAFANMSLMDIENAQDAIKEVSRVLKHGGRFVASLSHPCFDIMSNSGWMAEKTLGGPTLVYRKVKGYRKQFMGKIPWSLGEDRWMFTRSFHRPLNWYARTLYSNCLAIIALEEPEPNREFVKEEQKKPGDLDGAGFLEVPLHLVIEAIKL